MRVGSVFSGIGGFDEGFRRAGFDLAWMCEREPFCRTVLARHFPNVPCFEDVTTLTEAPAIDVLVGGFPCQDVSVAGQRRGLAGERTGLFWEFMRLVDRFQPKAVVLENVPGLFSSHGGRDFYTVLQALAERGLRRSYRVLDSQYFGVPQRRRRVFLVGGARGLGLRPETVLFESASRTRDSQARREARARVAASLRGRSSRAGVNEPGRGGEDDSNLVVGTLGSAMGRNRGLGNANEDSMLAYALTENVRNRSQGPANYVTGPLGGGNDGIGRRTEDDPNLVYGERERALTSSMHKRHDEDTDTLVVNALCPVGGGPDDNDARAGYLVASPITASAGHHGHHANQRGELRMSERAGSLNGSKSGKQYEGVYSHGVRRLTPIECERLQGFPDGWTCLCGKGHRGSQFCSCPDTPRYKALGNAVTVPVAEWIARRLMTALIEGIG